MKKSSFILLFTLFFFCSLSLSAKEREVKPAQNNKTPVVTELGTWVEQASGFAAASRGINSMKAVSSTVAWGAAYNGTTPTAYIVEYTKTTNGGTNWAGGAIAGYASGWGSAMIYATSATKAWMPVFNTTAGGGRILYTSDGGTTWATQTTAAFAAPAGFPNVVHFWDDNEGFCQGDPNGGFFEIYRTTNGGTNWTRVPQANIPAHIAADEYGIVGYYSVVGNTIWFSTNKGRIYKSLDKGLTWTVTQTQFGNVEFKIKFKDANYGIAMVTSTGVSYKSTNGGTTWTLLSPIGPFFTNDYTFVPGTPNAWVSTGAATGASGASYSLNDGANWTDFPGAAGIQFLAVSFADPISGWAGAFNTSATVGGVRKYTGQPLPVELVSFNASQVGNTVLLNWATATEINNYGFEVERKLSGAGLSDSWVTIGFKQGFGTTADQKSYSFSDDINGLGAEKIQYRLKQIDFDGTSTYSSVVNIDNVAPAEFKLLQNYPNPFNPSTSIKYQLASEVFVSLTIYNTLGQEVKTLVSGVQKAGTHTVEFNASDLASGIYLAVLKTGNNEFIQSMKLNLLK